VLVVIRLNEWSKQFVNISCVKLLKNGMTFIALII